MKGERATSPTPLETARAWVDGVNARDAERVLELSDAEIEIVGPRGSGFGHALLRQWRAGAGARRPRPVRPARRPAR
ncbi:MAG TPA: hypothetical protein VFQ39_09680, partial [Longimicrobium sp.]|nr:hypothetical protein [Longimicrobium sp.]